MNDILNNATQKFAETLSGVIDPIIIILFIGVLIAVVISFRFRKINDKIYDSMNQHAEYKLAGKKGRNIVEGEKSLPELGKMVKFDEHYNRIRKGYVVCQLMIPIFPLLGILGTVDGLIINMANGQNQMIDSLSVALYSTFWGLIASIALKIIDSIFIAPVTQSIEGQLDSYDSMYEKLNLQRASEAVTSSRSVPKQHKFSGDVKDEL